MVIDESIRNATLNAAGSNSPQLTAADIDRFANAYNAELNRHQMSVGQETGPQGRSI